MQITVSEIARRAGVSPATVSRVMNGESVSPEKTERVSAILNQLDGFQARPRKRRGQETHYIGILSLQQTHYDDYSLNIKLTSLLEMLPNNWRLLYLPRTLSAVQLECIWRRRDISGLLIFGHSAPHLSGVLDTIPHVWMNSHLSEANGAEILSGNEQAGRLAARYLIEKGSRHPLVLKLKSINPGLQNRIDGFNFEYYAQFGAIRTLICPVWNIMLETTDINLLEAAIDKAVTPDLLKKCDGIFVPEASLAALMHRILHRRGLHVFPAMVTCNQNSDMLFGLYPRPAVIDLGPEFLSRLALEQLFAKINGNETKIKRTSVIVTPVLVPGE